jgi:hypothetical protein
MAASPTLRRDLRRRSHAAKCLAAAVGLLRCGAAAADDSTSYEFWPQVDSYVAIGERSRLMFSVGGTRGTEAAAGTNALQNVQFTANWDYTLPPILRYDVPRAEWSKSRLLWPRLGFEYGSSGSSSDDPYRSYTGVAELNGRQPVGHDVWLQGRLRVDLRDVNGESSQRYRVRVGAEWDTVAFDHPVAPYSTVELVYDTRYDAWSRATLKLGLETPIDASWRVEPYLALQLNRNDDTTSRVIGLGLTFKVYFD